MDNLIFLEPLTPSSSQPRLPGARSSSNTSGPPSLSGQHITTQLNQRNAFSKDQTAKSRVVRGPSQKSHSDQRYRNQDQDSTQPSPNNDDDFPSIDELLSGILQKNSSASAAPTGVDEDGFVDIDEVLSGTQQKSIIASANLNSGGKAVLIDNGTRGGSPADSSCSIAGSSQDPIILSDDESAGAESETDCSDLDVDVRAKNDSDPPYVADIKLTNGDGFGSGVALISDRLVTDHQDDNNDHDGVINKIQLRLSDNRPRPASLDPGSNTQQASKPLDATMELESEGLDVFAKGDGVDSRSTKGRTLSAVPDNYPASDRNISQLQDGQPNYTQSPQLNLTPASLHQPDTESDHVPKQLRRGPTRNGRYKHPRTIAPIGLTSTAFAALESTDPDEAQPHAIIMSPDQEMADDRSTTDSNDEDYAAGPKIGGRSRPRKRARRTTNTEDNAAAAPSSGSLDFSCHAVAATSSDAMQESEEIPMHGYFTLKTVASKVVYCLTFTQELPPQAQATGQKQDSPTDFEEPPTIAPGTDANHVWGIRKIIDWKVVGDEKHYKVQWEDTWMSEDELAGAGELVDEFEAKLRHAQGRSGEGRQKRSRTEAYPPVRASDSGGEKVTKKPRGRPRKQK
ncbi:hypothetical protein ACEPPN_006459 [Leptodophora sp. 'Broadleaf-Isolate-01']